MGAMTPSFSFAVECVLASIPPQSPSDLSPPYPVSIIRHLRQISAPLDSKSGPAYTSSVLPSSTSVRVFVCPSDDPWGLAGGDYWRLVGNRSEAQDGEK